jgi:hypothetical protein
VTYRPVAEQWLSEHVPTEAYRGTVGRLFLGSGAVNTITNT